jgi:hypothetical protein
MDYLAPQKPCTCNLSSHRTSTTLGFGTNANLWVPSGRYPPGGEKKTAGVMNKESAQAERGIGNSLVTTTTLGSGTRLKKGGKMVQIEYTFITNVG